MEQPKPVAAQGFRANDDRLMLVSGHGQSFVWAGDWPKRSILLEFATVQELSVPITLYWWMQSE